MSRVSHTANLVAAASPARCIDVVREFLLSKGMEMRHDIDEEIEGYGGSPFITRRIGGWMANSAKLPIWVRIYCQPVSDRATSVILVLEEALAREMIDQKFEERYQRGFRELLRGLETLLS